jgi:hypothetical protein
MWAFVLAGILYLLGVGVVLYIKPNLMFTPDGQWKEFGIGQRDDRYSPFPFWLFCLVWAIVSYILVSLVLSIQTKQVRHMRRVNAVNVSPNIEYEDNTYDLGKDTKQLPKGYYVLNKKATRLSGVPKYVFIGEEEP